MFFLQLFVFFEVFHTTNPTNYVLLNSQKYIATLDMEKTITAICNISYVHMNPTMNNRCS